MQSSRFYGMRIAKVATMAIAAAALVGCTTVQTPTKGDPFEGFNRTVFKFNDTVDQYALKPVARGYVFVTPQPVRSSVTNFFSNIGDVYIAANNFLQLKITDGVEDVMRIVINTVFGVGGLFDVATLAKLPKHENDFGLTLGHYGVPAGPYLVLPLFGPSTARDTVGLVGNYYVNPLSYVDPWEVSWSLYALNIVNTRANLLNAGDVLEGAALDKYSFLRNAYLQRRQFLLSNGKTSSALPDYGNADEGNLPQYDTSGLDDGAAAPAGASGAAAAAAPGVGAPAAGATGNAGTQPAVPAFGGAAAAAAPASGASGVNAASPDNDNSKPETTQVPGGQLVPPTRFNFPSLRLR